MALTPYLSPLTFPAGTEIPGTMQGLANLLAQYLAVNGLSELGGINFGPTTPSEANRDKPWFKTDGSYNPIGFFSWNGSAWVTFDTGAIPSGPTASRLTSPRGAPIRLGRSPDPSPSPTSAQVVLLLRILGCSGTTYPPPASPSASTLRRRNWTPTACVRTGTASRSRRAII